PESAAPVHHPTLSRMTSAPAATPFPYTTLFRSARRRPPLSDRRHQPPATQTARRMERHNRGSPGPHAPSIAPAPAPRQWKGHAGDRKSTRLNSSHVAISYAVFCLKKKTNTRNVG